MTKAWIILGLLLLIAQSKTGIQKRAAVFDIQQINIEANKTQTIVLTSLDPKKVLMINIELGRHESNLNSFSITVENKNGDSPYCQFKHANNLCVVERVSKEITLLVRCVENTCKEKLIFSQRTLVRVPKMNLNTYTKSLVIPGEIFKVQTRKFNSILEIFSQKQQNQVLSNQLYIFSNIHIFTLDQIEELDKNSAIYGLKPIVQPNDKYFYIQNTNAKNNYQLKVSLKTRNQQLYVGQSVVDFIENYGKQSKNLYTYKESFSHNIQVNVKIFSPRNPQQIPFALKIYGKIQETDQPNLIKQIKIKSINFNGHKFYDFTFIITKKIHQKYKRISFQTLLDEIQNRAIFIEIYVSDIQIYQLNIFRDVFFASQKSETLKFVVQPQVIQFGNGDKQIQLLTNANEKYYSNVQTCSLHKWCHIQIKTDEKCNNCSFKFDLKSLNVSNQIIYYEVQDNSIEGKIDLEEDIYFRYTMEGKAITQVIVNSINVMIYASFDYYGKCKLPTAGCHQYAINQHNPLVITNKYQKPSQLIISVFGLQKTLFKVRFINQTNGLMVKHGQKFTYLFDDQQKDMSLHYTLDAQAYNENSKHLSFNLISPTNSLKLTVQNKDGQSISSHEGYVIFERSHIKSNEFTINIQKINQYYDDYVHFTLIVSSNDQSVRLDSSITHYQKYLARMDKKFIMEYDPSIDNAINIYTENLEKYKQTMTLDIKIISNEDDQSQKTVLTKKLVNQYELIDIDDQLDKLNVCEDMNCQLEITIKNDGDIELQQSITVLREESLIYLDDSIWSVFEINSLSTKNHFYFIPRHQNKSINILFNTDDSHLFINYRIHNTNNSINPQNWPFSHINTLEEGFSGSNQEITIAGDDKELKACWPTCVILINLNEVQGKDTLHHDKNIRSYRILATNSILQLPQDTKLQFSLRNQEEKTLFILVKNFMTSQTLTFFTYFSLGRAKISAQLTSHKKQYKLGPKGKEFTFQYLQTKLPISTISSIIINQQLNLQQTMLRITIIAQTNLKMTLEYSSYARDIYRLKMDDLEISSLRKGEQVWYQFIPQRDFSLKLYRIKGFPLFKFIKCKSQDYVGCLSKNRLQIDVSRKEFQQSEGVIKQNLKQDSQILVDQRMLNSTFDLFVQKNYQYSQQPCQNCIFYLWIYCFEVDLEISINLRSRSSEIELKQMSVISERVQYGHHNRYLLNIHHDSDAYITVRMLQGTALVSVIDHDYYLSNQTLDSDNDYWEIKIDAELVNEEQQSEEDEQSEQDQDAINNGLFNNVRKSSQNYLFRKIHVLVQALNGGPVQFLLSYSIGARNLFLEDGIIVQKKLIPNIPYNYFYHNKDKKQHAYLTITSQNDEQYLENQNQKQLNVKFYYYPNANNRNIKEQFHPEIPPRKDKQYLGALRSKSDVYELPAKYELYEIEISSNQYLRVTVSINHQQLVYLPHDYEYLIQLQPEQTLNLVIDKPKTEYLEVKIKKCDTSTPILRYTNDAIQFKKKIFEAEIYIENSIFKQYITTKKKSRTMHLQFIGDQSQDSLFLVSVFGSTKQMKSSVVKYSAGNNGLISYKIIEAKLVEVRFKPILCQKHQCKLPSRYFIVVSSNLEDMYGELNCAGNYFVPQSKESADKNTKIIDLTDNDYNTSQKEYIYKVALASNQAFIGVRALAQDSMQQITYTPIKITSIFGQLFKMSNEFILIASIALTFVITIVIYVSTKLARKGYKPISMNQ